MAQKIEVIRASFVSDLSEKYASLVADVTDGGKDPRFILTPSCLTYGEDEWVLLVHIEAPHKTKFDKEETSWRSR